MSIVYNGLGNVYLSQKKFSEAELYLLKSIAYSKEYSATSYSALFQVYLEIGKLREAKACLDSSKIPTNNAYTHMDNLYQYSALAYAEGKYKEAYDYLSQYVDTTYTDLLIKNELKLIDSEKKYNHTKVTLENIHLKKLKARIFAGIVFLILVLIIIVAVFFLLLNRKKIELLTTQKYISDMDEELTTNKVRMKNYWLKLMRRSRKTWIWIAK